MSGIIAIAIKDGSIKVEMRLEEYGLLSETTRVRFTKLNNENINIEFKKLTELEAYQILRKIN